MIVRQPGGPLTKLDPNGQYMVEQMYVQYYLPRNRKGKLPFLMWHGGGLTGVTYESTPDGREGWLNLFVRKGWDVYVSDAVERGRSGFASPDIWPSEPTFLTYADGGGVTVDVINLPDLGIRGNSHMLMQDKNNAEIAEVIQKWLVGKNVVD